MSNDMNLDLLDMNLDDIEDLPGFEAPYPGEYLLGMKAQVKVVNDRNAVAIDYEVKECLKKNNDADPDTIPGTKFSQLFFLQGDPDAVKISLGQLKALMMPLAEALGEGNLLLLVRDHLATEQLVQATCGRRQDKQDKERFYPTVKNLSKA